MTVIGFVGLPGSGKSEAAAVARDLDVPVVTMGDVIRAECRDRGLDPAEHHGSVAVALREEHGEDAVAQRALPFIEDALEDHDTVVVDGIRSAVEVHAFETAFGDDFSLVSIEAPFEIRADRVTTRGRDKSADEGGEALADRDARELGFGMGTAMETADVVVENTTTLAAFHDIIRVILTRGPEAIAE